MTAKTLRRGPRRRRTRAAKTGNARQAIGTIEPGCELYVLTFGQFSLCDALVALLEQTGPASVALSTWTAANADLRRTLKLLEHASITDLRMVVDRSFLTRKPRDCQALRELFGDECIRTMNTHAKFMTIQNDTWSLAVRTSMNLNGNPRLENIEISDDPELCAFMTTVVDDVFREQDQGTFDGELTPLSSIPDFVQPSVAAGAVTNVGGRPSTGVRT